MKSPTALLTAVAILLTSGAVARSEPAAPSEYDAIAGARQDLKLGFTVGGKIRKIAIKAGQTVETGVTLIQLENEEKQSLVEVYKIRAASDIEVRSAEAKLKLAQLEEEGQREMFEKNVAARLEFERAKASLEVAKLELELAKRTSIEIKEQLHQAQAQADQYVLKAPEGGGVIDEVTVAEGEMVEAGKPVLRLVLIDPLWIDVAVPTERTLTLKDGDPVWIKSKLTGFEKPMEGKILYLRKVADSAADRLIVRVEVPNPKCLPAGVNVAVSFSPPTGATAAAEGKR
ncbi:MAG: efflux RND transporter periplasmic adaptor subunit [Planctomycetes bacterium]|nr:efflux RND transporter periplasmic adaptor subunit [Planctomycetota bacterium]